MQTNDALPHDDPVAAENLTLLIAIVAAVCAVVVVVLLVTHVGRGYLEPGLSRSDANIVDD